MINERRYFHTFNSLRFFSFLLVFVSHIPNDKSSLISFFSKSGGIGVSFFFVLSGFLITYILMFEKINKDKISLKKFFARRILRIWPLYYAMILFAFLTPYILEFLNLPSSDEGYEPNLLTSMLFLENYKMMYTGSFPNASPLRVMWTICVEEYFYLIWGIIFYFISAKKTPILIGICIITANIFRIIYNHYGIYSYDIFSNIDYFAYGAIPAYILLYKSTYLDKIEKISLNIKYILLFITIALIFVIPNIKLGWITYFSPTIYGILFSTVILFTLPSSNFIHIKDKYLISKLGIFTYGLYLIHTIIINLLLQTKNMFPFEINWFILATLSLILTILISISSYHLFEKHFLKLKKYFY